MGSPCGFRRASCAQSVASISRSRSRSRVHEACRDAPEVFGAGVESGWESASGQRRGISWPAETHSRSSIAKLGGSGADRFSAAVEREEAAAEVAEVVAAAAMGGSWEGGDLGARFAWRGLCGAGEAGGYLGHLAQDQGQVRAGARVRAKARAKVRVKARARAKARAWIGQ